MEEIDSMISILDTIIDTVPDEGMKYLGMLTKKHRQIGMLMNSKMDKFFEKRHSEAKDIKEMKELNNVLDKVIEILEKGE